MAFERAPANADFIEHGPVPSLLIPRYGNPAAILPEAARLRWQALQQRWDDAKALSMPMVDGVNELRMDAQREQARLRQLTLPKSAGGFGLRASTEKEPTDDIQVRDVERKIAAISEELQRKQVLLEDRSARTNNVGRLCERGEQWLSGGIPGGNRVVDHGEIAISSVLKRNETERQALERLQRRSRELLADENRARSAPLPSSEGIGKARTEIERLAQRGEPDVSALVEVGAPIRWPQTVQRLDLVAMTHEQKSIFGDARGEVADPLALLCWLHRDQLLTRLEKLIAENSDDGNALSEQDRAEKLAEIDGDRLEVERQEAALIWRMQEAGQSVDFRQDADIRAVLGVRLEVTDDVTPFGQAADYSHVIEIR
ncbi:hypothetical protein ACH79_42120 [Bradyrhizobium sp. CCBAU 051011]|uniref:hypothetical protein n=1 Tax=Bradyrhizobium sp. CCBAU 051011 TaxID=858422 RepID=UPI00137395D2|nr:hypothetical protein [Bradyrhizobium sp. CCBAU 051011]QHO78205.1 hypothetical protein ACH79_42120 [Bradyrhizobium sp. CCBAU 051011]